MPFSSMLHNTFSIPISQKHFERERERERERVRERAMGNYTMMRRLILSLLIPKKKKKSREVTHKYTHTRGKAIKQQTGRKHV